MASLCAQALNVSFFLTFVVCSLVAGAGYAMYGPAVRDVVTFNLPRVRRFLCVCGGNAGDAGHLSML